MKSFFILFLILFSFAANSQVDESDTLLAKEDTIQGHRLFEYETFSYEQSYFLSDFQKQLKNIEKLNFRQPCNSISFGFIGPLSIGRSYNFPGIFAFSYIIPSKITLNDSLKEKLHGFNTTLSLAGQNIIKRKHIGLFITEGIKGGRIKLVDDQHRKMKNSAFGPFGAIVLRTTISHFTVFTSGQFWYDITSTQWKPTWVSKRQNVDITPFRQSCFTFTIGISYSLNSNPRQ